MASRAAKASWIRPSITLRARASRPTSVVSSSPGTRCSRLPAAMAFGGGLDVARAGAGPAGPATARRQGSHQGAGGDRQLDQQEAVERAWCRSSGVPKMSTSPSDLSGRQHPELGAPGDGGATVK